MNPALPEVFPRQGMSRHQEPRLLPRHRNINQVLFQAASITIGTGTHRMTPRHLSGVLHLSGEVNHA
jgi:hypothetical protein